MLPPTKLERKRKKLIKTYEKIARRNMAKASSASKKKDGEDAAIQAAPTSYDRNKLKNSGSHIAMPDTAASPVVSDPSTAKKQTLYDVNQ